MCLFSCVLVAVLNIIVPFKCDDDETWYVWELKRSIFFTLLSTQMIYPYFYTYLCCTRDFILSITSRCKLWQSCEYCSCGMTHTGHSIKSFCGHFLPRCRFIVKNVQNLKTSTICKYSGIKTPASVYTWLCVSALLSRSVWCRDPLVNRFLSPVLLACWSPADGFTLCFKHRDGGGWAA